MRFAILAAAPALLIAPAAFAASPTPESSWGKAGVSFEEYRRDAVECGRLGANRDVSGTNGARIFRAASQQLDTVTDSGSPVVNMWETDHPDASFGGATNTRYNEAPTHVVETGQRIDRVVQGVRPEQRIREVRAFMEEAVTACLAERGYHRFRLTAAQRQHLGRLRYGTPERHAYLYALASDPQVLARQVIA